jgi:hypothetical protein
MGLAFKHSGRLGDIIYSLPLVKQLAEEKGEAADFFVPSDTPANLTGNVYHPGGSLMVSEALFKFVRPLLAAQPYIRSASFVPTSDIPSSAINLDAFRTSGLNLGAGCIQGWYRKVFGVAFPLEAVWLTVPAGSTPKQSDVPAVVVNRTTRYCNTSINYQVLDAVGQIGFIGLDYELQEFVTRFHLRNVLHLKPKDALEMAQIMVRAKVFVGNQSFCFSVAEGLKVPRAQEVFEPVPVATPTGGFCTEYIRTEALGRFLSTVLGRPIASPPDLPGDYQESIKAQPGYKPSLRKRIKKFFKGM